MTFFNSTNFKKKTKFIKTLLLRNSYNFKGLLFITKSLSFK